MKIRQLIPMVNLERFTIVYSGVIGSFLFAGLVAGIWALFDPCVSMVMARFPTPVAGLLGASLAVIGGFLISAWRHKQEKNEQIKNLAHIIGHETNNYLNRTKYFVELFLQQIADNGYEINREYAKTVINFHNKYFTSDIFIYYRKDISIFDDKILEHIIIYFNFIKVMDNYFKNDDEKNIDNLINSPGFYANTIKQIILGHYSFMEQLSTVYPPIMDLLNANQIDDNLMELAKADYRDEP